MQEQNFNKNWIFYNTITPENKIRVNLPHDAMQTEKRLPGVKGGAASGYYPGGHYIYLKKFDMDQSWQDKRILLEFDGVHMNSRVYINDVEVGGRIYGYSHFVVDLTDHLSEENTLRVDVDNTRTPNSRWYSGSGIYRDVKILVCEKNGFSYEGIRLTTTSTDPAVVQIEADVESDGLVSDGLLSASVDVKYLGILSHENEGYRTPEMYEKLIDEAPSILSSNIEIKDGVARGALEVPNVKLWDYDNPHLYAFVFTLKKGEDILDRETIRYGIRKLSWNVTDGFMVNGRMVKLKGGCIHHDNGMLGASEYRKASYRKIRILKETGYNAVRMSHHPMSKVLLDACDDLGMYVLDESFDMWEKSKNDYDYSIYFEKEWVKDVVSMVKKDYNRPSVIMYGIGNELQDLSTERGLLIQEKMVKLIHDMDSTRPVTNACIGSIGISKPKPLGKEKLEKGKSPDDVVDPYFEDGDGKMRGSLLINTIVTFMPFLNKLTNRADSTVKNAGKIMDDLDITGFNYANTMIEGISELRDNVLLLNTETYPKSIGENWPAVENNNAIVGDFMWTAWDYLGEAGVGLVQYGKKRGDFSKPYPCVSGGIGSVDMTGFVEAQGKYTSVVWGVEKNPYIGVRPVNHSGEQYFMGTWRGTDALNSWDWDGCEGREAEIEVYSQYPKVELILNGESLGIKTTEHCKANFTCPYKQGELKAIAYDDKGQPQGESVLRSGDKEPVLSVSVETEKIYADGEDLAYVVIEITDKNGIKKMLSDRRIHVEVSGAGTLAGLGSGNPETTDPFTGNECMTWYGRAVAVVRAGDSAGKIDITVTADDMEAKTVTVETV